MIFYSYVLIHSNGTRLYICCSCDIVFYIDTYSCDFLLTQNLKQTNTIEQLRTSYQNIGLDASPVLTRVYRNWSCDHVLSPFLVYNMRTLDVRFGNSLHVT